MSLEFIEYEALAKGVEEGTHVVVDVRTPEEVAELGKIPGSVNIPLKEVKDVFKSLPDKEFQIRYGFSKNSDKAIVLSCQSGKRAANAYGQLAPLGLSNPLLLYQGSFVDWINHGGRRAANVN